MKGPGSRVIVIGDFQKIRKHCIVEENEAGLLLLSFIILRHNQADKIVFGRGYANLAIRRCSNNVSLLETPVYSRTVIATDVLGMFPS